MLKGFKHLKGSGKVDVYLECFKRVEEKLDKNIEPNMDELRKWFIYKMEQHYDTKLLGTNNVYCYKTFNNVKDKFKMKSNLELAKSIVKWHKNYIQEYSDTFDFSKLNTDWLLEKLNKESSYSIDNDYRVNTKDRRI